jgi:hypothetical protein
VKIKTLKLFVVFILSTVINSCGTTGHLKFYYYNDTKQNVEKDLLKTITDNKYSAPKNWNKYEQGSDTLRDIFIMFNSTPKEIYQLGFKGDSTEWRINKRSCTLALVGVFDGQLWHFEKDLNSEEINRIEARLENEILNKMEIKH